MATKRRSTIPKAPMSFLVGNNPPNHTGSCSVATRSKCLARGTDCIIRLRFGISATPMAAEVRRLLHCIACIALTAHRLAQDTCAKPTIKPTDAIAIHCSFKLPESRREIVRALTAAGDAGACLRISPRLPTCFAQAATLAAHQGLYIRVLSSRGYHHRIGSLNSAAHHPRLSATRIVLRFQDASLPWQAA